VAKLFPVKQKFVCLIGFSLKKGLGVLVVAAAVARFVASAGQFDLDIPENRSLAHHFVIGQITEDVLIPRRLGRREIGVFDVMNVIHVESVTACGFGVFVQR
jgi:hypothetical protein